MSNDSYVDGLLVRYGEKLFNRSPIKSTPSPSEGGGLLKKSKSDPSKIVGRATANEIRSKLGSITKRTPEVMVKISGGGTGMNAISAHLDYISRNGKIELEDQEGNRSQGRDDLKDVKEEWKSGGRAIPDEGKRKEAINIVLSMPAGTDEVGLRKAVREFAESKFSGHQYVMALHTYSTDPDPSPSKHPHVHLTVKSTALDGKRLHPKKGDLQEWRELFAEKLRDHGIEAAATSRQQRLQRERGEKLSVKKMRDRGVELEKIGKSVPDLNRARKARKTRQAVLQGYKDIATVLAGSDSAEDRRLAADIVGTLSKSQDVQKDPNKDHLRDRDKVGKDIDR